MFNDKTITERVDDCGHFSHALAVQLCRDVDIEVVIKGEGPATQISVHVMEILQSNEGNSNIMLNNIFKPGKCGKTQKDHL